MCAIHPNLVETSCFLELEFLLKTASLRSVKHCSLTPVHIFGLNLHIGRSKASNTSPKFQSSHHYQYSFVASTRVVAFPFLGARFYIDSFVLKCKTLIRPIESHVSDHQKFGSCTLYTKQPVVADVGHLAIVFSSGQLDQSMGKLFHF